MVFRFTRRLLGGGVLHPDAYRGGRVPGQGFPHTIGQFQNIDILVLLFALSAISLQAWVMRQRYFNKRECAWVDENYYVQSAYQKDWAEKHVPKNPGFRIHDYPLLDINVY